MKRYNNYKKISFRMHLNHFYNKLFDSRVKKIVLHSVIAFCGGIAVAWSILYAAGNIKAVNGVGGLETSGVPEFKEAVVEKLQASVPSVAVSSTAISDSVLESEEGSLEELDELALLDSMSEGAVQDASTGSMPVVPGANIDSDSLELCYTTYRVKTGDMIGFIADKFGITQDTIISVNNIRQSRLLQIGQYLKIPSMPGIIYTVKKTGETAQTIAAKYEVSAEKFARVNNIDQNVALVSGQTVFVPDAQLDWVTKQEINGDLFHKPIHGRYYMSSYYGWRSSPFTGKRSYHSGCDMACASGTPIYAALGGTVTAVGFNNVYGNYIIITHHSGYKTLYGHMRERAWVEPGRWVDQGKRIGSVGSTGLSTGPHLHFTVYKFGKTVNPAALWK